MQVNLKLFQAAPGKHKTILLIVIRDRTRTPHAKMAADMRADLDSIWASLVKPPEYVDAPLDDFFELQYVSLPSFEVEEDEFRAECTFLRRRFTNLHEDSFLRLDDSKVRSRNWIRCRCSPERVSTTQAPYSLSIQPMSKLLSTRQPAVSCLCPLYHTILLHKLCSWHF